MYPSATQHVANHLVSSKFACQSYSGQALVQKTPKQLHICASYVMPCRWRTYHALLLSQLEPCHHARPVGRDLDLQACMLHPIPNAAQIQTLLSRSATSMRTARGWCARRC